MKIELTPAEAQVAFDALSTLLDQMILSDEREQQAIDVANRLWSAMVDLYN